MQNNMLDIMHRGYSAYLEVTQNNADCDKLRRSVLRTDKTGELCDTALCTCEIETDWLEQIEASLPYIERAVHENRQFILRQGETVPIEKVRRVSKTSVEHLARHSELITREPEQGDEIIPEKILMTENVSTYAIYENRFLYMLLCYVKDFAEIKFAKITELSSSFSSEIVFDKSLSGKNRKISFSLKYKEISTENALTELSEQTADCLERIKNVMSSVDALLKTGLMIEVSAAPLLKPPIARTNVLLQNPCFAAAMELYDYLSAYTGDGYTQKDIYRHHGEWSDEARADYAELVAIVSYLSYRHGGLYDELEERYQNDEKARKEKERKERDDRINALKEKLGDLDPIAAAYIMALEDECRDARDGADALIAVKEQLRTDREKLEAAEKGSAALKAELDKTNRELSRREALERSNAQEYRRELDNASRLVRQKEEEIKQTVANYEAELEKLNDRFRAEYEALAEKYHLQSARLRAVRAGDGASDTEEDFSSKEAFAELEAEYRAFKRFFESQWRIAKKRIRRDQLWKKADH